MRIRPWRDSTPPEVRASVPSGRRRRGGGLVAAEGAAAPTAVGMWRETSCPSTAADKEKEEGITAMARLRRPHPYLSERCTRTVAGKVGEAIPLTERMRLRQNQRRPRPYLSERCVPFPTRQPKVPVLAIASG